MSRLFVELHGWGDKARGKYPLQVLLLMDEMGFAARRIGKSYSYDFVKAGILVVYTIWFIGCLSKQLSTCYVRPV